MEFVIDDAVLEDMAKKKRRGISVEVATSENSDFEVTEIYLRYVRDEFADYLVEKKNYRRFQAGTVFVLLPPYRMHYDPVVRIHFEKHWIFRRLAVTGIQL